MQNLGLIAQVPQHHMHSLWMQQESCKHRLRNTTRRQALLGVLDAIRLRARWIGPGVSLQFNGRATGHFPFQAESNDQPANHMQGSQGLTMRLGASRIPYGILQRPRRALFVEPGVAGYVGVVTLTLGSPSTWKINCES